MSKLVLYLGGTRVVYLVYGAEGWNKVALPESIVDELVARGS